jgi:hypothetical protein
MMRSPRRLKYRVARARREMTFAISLEGKAPSSAALRLCRVLRIRPAQHNTTPRDGRFVNRPYGPAEPEQRVGGGRLCLPEP